MSGVSAYGVDVTALFWSVAIKSIWEWLKEAFGDGETGSASSDSSKKEGRGAGCRAMAGSWVVRAETLVISMVCAEVLASRASGLAWGWEVLIG